MATSSFIIWRIRAVDPKRRYKVAAELWPLTEWSSRSERLIADSTSAFAAVG